MLRQLFSSLAASEPVISTSADVSRDEAAGVWRRFAALKSGKKIQAFHVRTDTGSVRLYRFNAGKTYIVKQYLGGRRRVSAAPPPGRTAAGRRY
jgi:hypothetical protein